jgi:hypothetical protein
MTNPVQKQPNGEELAEVSAFFEEYGLPYCGDAARSDQSGGNSPGSDTSVNAKRMALAALAAEAVFNNPDVEPEFEPDDVASARAAVERLESLFTSASGTFTALLEGARSGAEVLSGNRLQGLSEIVQNADDAGATEVHFLLQPDALLIAHNGRPVRLRDVHALATPWVTTKRHDSKAIGRFGIGLMTLQALSDTFDLHSSPYNVRFADPVVTAIEPLPVPTGFANADDTIFRVPLAANTLDSGTLSSWAEAWDDPALLFCNGVSKVTINTSNSSNRTLMLQWKELTPRRATIGGADTNVRRRRATAPDGRMWDVHTAEATSPVGVRRVHKAIGSNVPVGIALSLNGTDEGQMYAGLPVTPIAHAVRVNAQFDPLANRQDLADTPWNAAISGLVADLWQAAVVDMFETNPPAAWRSIPLPVPITRSGTGAVVQFESLLVTHAREILPPLLTIQVDDTLMHLTQLATEVLRLSSVLSEKEIAELAGLSAALPFNVRDPEDRWRTVLSDWRQSGADLVQPVSVKAALALFNSDGRSAQQTIALAAAALDEHLCHELVRLPCVMTHEGSMLPPPAATDPWMFVTSNLQLARELGVARVLHEAYSTDERDAQQVKSWLQSQGAITDATDAIGVLRRLALAGQAGKHIEGLLGDTQLKAIRDAFEALSQSDREKLGPGVGQAIVINGYRFDEKAKRIPTPTSPAHMYLPRSIDKEPESFALAAGNTEGLTWVDPRYAGVLRSPLGRAGLGAQRFLRLLGAETAPRLYPHPSLEYRYQNERKRGLAKHAGSSRERARAMTNIGATFTLEDMHCPDLIAVLSDISRDRNTTQRQQRTSALLATLGRSWDRFSELAEVTAAVDNYAWRSRGTIKAFWLWQAVSIPWLDDSSSQPTAPTALRLRTPGTVAVYGPEAEGYLHKDLHRARPDVLALFGVTGDPNTSDLVERLRTLRDSDADDVARLRVGTSIIYQALADRLNSRVQVPGDLPIGSLRQVFGAGEGLILTNLGWRQPSQVLRGTPVFGNRHAFTPSVPSTARLWSELRVQKPAVADCVKVLFEIAKDSQQPDTIQQTIILETLRYLAAELSRTDKPSGSLSQKLAKLPLWIGEKWMRLRPVYAVGDPILANGLRSQVAVWQPGGELTQFKSLLVPLRLTELSAESANVAHGETVEVDEEATALLRASVLLLREDFARNDPETGNSLRISWDQLSRFEVRVASDLQVEIADVPNCGPLTLSVNAITDSRASTLYVTKQSLMTSVEAGGQAIAGLFTANRRSVAQAWLAACTSAKLGREALLLELANDRQKKEEAQRSADIEERMAAIQNETQMTHSKRRASRADASQRILTSPSNTAISTSNPSNHPAASSRNLVDSSRYRIIDTRGRITGTPNNAGSGRINNDTSEADGEATPKALPTPNNSEMPPIEHSRPRAYTEIAKESVGLDFVRQVFASDKREMRDLRVQHGVGADAVDALDRFFELKVYAGAEPDRIVLEYSQIRRAMSTPNFFLVVVSELEGENASPKVRVIIDPLSQLSMSESSSVTFTGVRSSRSVVYQFEQED